MWLAFEADATVHKRRKIGKKYVVGVRSGCYSPQKTQNRQKLIVWLALGLGVDDAVRERRKIGKKIWLAFEADATVHKRRKIGKKIFGWRSNWMWMMQSAKDAK